MHPEGLLNKRKIGCGGRVGQDHCLLVSFENCPLPPHFQQSFF